MAVEGEAERQEEFRIAAAAPGTLHRHRRLAAGEQHAGGAGRLAMLRAGLGDAGHGFRHLARFALDGVAKDEWRDAGLARRLGRRRQRTARRGDDARLAVGEAHIARLGRLADARLEHRTHLVRRFNAVFIQDRQCILAGGRVRQRRPGGHHGRIVSGYIGNHQRHHARRIGRRRQAAALDGGEVLPHAVHLADAGAAFQQGAVELLLVGQRDALPGQGQQSRAATGNQHQHQVVGSQPLHHGEDARRGILSRRVRHRMRRLDHLDAFAGHAMAVARHHQAGQLARPVFLHRPRHRRGRLAGADHQGAAPGRPGQVLWHASGRVGGAHGVREEARQQLPGCSGHLHES